MKDYTPFLDAIAKNQSANTQLLINWASVNSGSLNPQGLASILDLLYNTFSTLPADIQKLPLSSDPSSPQALHLSCRSNAPTQVFLNGHMDTVYGPDHPFQHCTQLDDNNLQGPGVTDMKGGLIVMLEALKSLESSPWANNIGWEVLVVPDEEIGSPLSTPFLKEAAKYHNLALAFEPAMPNGSLVRSRKGSGAFQITATGKASHAGRHFTSGVNAIVALSEFLIEIHALNEQFPGAIFNIGHIEGGGPINVVPDYAVAKINVRITQPQEEQQILERLNQLVDSFNSMHEAKIGISGRIARPPKPPSESADYLYEQFKHCGDSLNIPLGWEDSGGAADGNILAAAGLPNIDNLGVRGNNIHSDQEFIYLDSITERSQLTALFLMKLASGDIQLPKNLFPNLS